MLLQQIPPVEPMSQGPDGGGFIGSIICCLVALAFLVMLVKLASDTAKDESKEDDW